MNDVRISGDYNGIQTELLRGDFVKDIITEIAEAIADEAAAVDGGDRSDYDIDVKEGSRRYRGTVMLKSTSDSYWRDLKHNGLTKAAGRRRQ